MAISTTINKARRLAAIDNARIDTAPAFAIVINAAMSKIAITSFAKHHAEYQLPNPGIHPCLFKGLGDDDDAENRQDRSGEQALPRRPAHEVTHQVAEPDHRGELNERHHSRSRGEPDQSAKIELQADRENQHCDAEVLDEMDPLRTAYTPGTLGPTTMPATK